jgi:ribosomal 50S subunit-recycling heat shock protein
MFKTRSAATGAVLGGRVHVNGERVRLQILDEEEGIDAEKRAVVAE